LAILKKAKGLGFDEVILIGENGQVSEGAVSNYIFQINGDWVTTPLTAGVIPGVQRGIVIERCGVLVKSLTPADLLIAKRAMVISSLKIALPVASIGDYKLIVDEESSSMQEKIRTNTKAHSVG
jgi:branched-chain amino acid aminotransferase